VGDGENGDAFRAGEMEVREVVWEAFHAEVMEIFAVGLYRLGFDEMAAIIGYG
jgi:hypothetical protein